MFEFSIKLGRGTAMNDWSNLCELMGNLDENGVMDALDQFIATNPAEQETEEAVMLCQKGMSVVGDKFSSGEYFLGDLIFSGELLTSVFEKLKPLMGNASSEKVGTIVLGTVKGDLHDIGKNIFRSMAEAGGFEIIDLGIDQSSENFIKKVKEVKPQIVGLAGVLTLALNSMKDTIAALKAAGLRDDIKILIGGTPVTKEACEDLVADAYATNAAEAVKICQSWVG
jgi:methanogenic corrinoid protein MtbC1